MTEAAEGLWQLAETVLSAAAAERQANDVYTFLFEGPTVTLRLLSRHRGAWRSADDFYKLAARWRGRTLCYRPPFARFTEIADFEGGRFVNIGNGLKRIFRRIGPDEVVDWNRAILTPRAPHDYRIQPDGSVGEDPGSG